MQYLFWFHNERKSDYQEIRGLDTKVSGYQENRGQEIFKPDALMS
jgi:hypothetical protein